MKGALIQCVDIMEKGGSYEEIVKIVNNAAAVGTNDSKNGISFEDLYNLPEVYNQYYNKACLLRTGIHSYDSAFMGGLAPGELHVIQAAPKTGKSTLACNIGAFALSCGKTVYHCTLEIKEFDVGIKYAARLTGLTYAEILGTEKRDYYHDRMRQYLDRKPNLFINYWTMGNASALHLRSWISKKRSQTGKNPDLIIVDYDDCLVPVGGRSKGGEESMYNDAGHIYSELILMADYFNCPILTFAQPQRHAWNKFEKGELTVMQDLAHSARKAHKAYSVSSLNFKKDDNEGVLYIDVARRGESHRKVKIRRDLSRGIIKESI